MSCDSFLSCKGRPSVSQQLLSQVMRLLLATRHFKGKHWKLHLFGTTKQKEAFTTPSVQSINQDTNFIYRDPPDLSVLTVTEDGV